MTDFCCNILQFKFFWKSIPPLLTLRRQEDWVWSSYNAMISSEAASRWLDVDWTLSQFGQNRAQAISAYCQFVMEGKGLVDPKDQVKDQMFLGDDQFISDYRQIINKPEKLRVVSKAHKKSIALTLFEYQKRYTDRNEAMAKAYLSGAYTMAEIGRYFKVHYMTVSRAVKKFEDS